MVVHWNGQNSSSYLEIGFTLRLTVIFYVTLYASGLLDKFNRLQAEHGFLIFHRSLFKQILSTCSFCYWMQMWAGPRTFPVIFMTIKSPLVAFRKEVRFCAKSHLISHYFSHGGPAWGLEGWRVGMGRRWLSNFCPLPCSSLPFTGPAARRGSSLGDSGSFCGFCFSPMGSPTAWALQSGKAGHFLSQAGGKHQTCVSPVPGKNQLLEWLT